MMNSKGPMDRAMALAAISGLKIALGPAFLATSRRQPNARYWVMAALGEMFLDKIGVFPARFRLPLLIPHTLAGAWVAHESMKQEGVDDPMAAAMGAVVAAGVACVAPMVRITSNKVLGMPDMVMGVAEDYLALKLGAEATGMSMQDVADCAKGAIGDMSDQVKPALQSVGLGA